MDNDMKLKGDVIHITEDETSINYRWEKDSKRLPKAIQVVSVDDINQMAEADGVELFVGSSLESGMVLLKDPYSEKRYVEISKAEQEFYLSKRNAFSEICSLLGAKEISYNQKLEEVKERSIDCLGNLSYGKVDADLKYHKNTTQANTSEFDTKDFFGDSQLTEETYKEAEERAKRYGLLKESDVLFLLKKRHPEEKNKLMERTIRIELAREFNDLTDIAFKLNVLEGVFSLSTEFEEIVKMRKKVVMEYKVKF